MTTKLNFKYKLAINWLNNHYSNLSIHDEVTDSGNELWFYEKDGNTIFVYNRYDNYFSIEDKTIPRYLKYMFNLTYLEALDLMRTWVRETFNDFEETTIDFDYWPRNEKGDRFGAVIEEQDTKSYVTMKTVLEALFTATGIRYRIDEPSGGAYYYKFLVKSPVAILYARVAIYRKREYLGYYFCGAWSKETGELPIIKTTNIRDVKLFIDTLKKYNKTRKDR